MEQVKRKRGSRGGSSVKDSLDPVIKKTRRGGRGKSRTVDDLNEDAFPVQECQLESDTKAYLLSMEECLDSADEKDAEELEMIIQNIYREIDGFEFEVACDFETCRVLEKLLMLSNDFLLRVYAGKIKGRVNELIRDAYGSHVLQTLLVISADVVSREEKGDSLVELANEEALGTMNEFIMGLFKTLDGDWVELMNNTYASHVLRTFLCLLSGSDLSDNKSKKSKKYNSNHKISRISVGSRQVGDKFLEILEKITKSIIKTLKSSNDYVKEMAFNQNASPVLQIFLKNGKFSQSLVKLLIKDSDVEFLNQLIHDSVGSHLMEKVFGVISADLWKSLYRLLFKNHLIELSEHPVANFVVQRLIEHVPKEKTLLKIMKELSTCFQSFIFQNRIGLLSMIAKACISFENLQEYFMNQLLSCLGSETPRQSLVFQVLFNSNTFLEYKRPNLQGSLLIQHIMKFKPSLVTVVLNGIYSLESASLKKWSMDSVLSRILSSFLESNLEFKAKKKLILLFRGSLVSLAKDRIGSRVLDQLWLVSDITTREIMLKELLENEVELLNDFFGKFILTKAHWDLYKKRRDDWITLEKRVENRKNLFSEFKLTE